MLKPHILYRLEQAAERQHRTRNNLAAALIADGLQYRLNRVFIPYEKPPYVDDDGNADGCETVEQANTGTCTNETKTEPITKT